MRFAAIACIPLTVLTQPLLAQLPFREDLFSESRIDEITEGPLEVMVRGKRAETNGRVGGDFLVVCRRASPDREYLILQDRELQTDDRWGAEAGTCDALASAARQRKDAQGR